SAPLFRALERAGARVEFLEAREGWPVRIEAVGAASELELIEPVSSQEISALLLAASAHAQESTLFVRGAIPSAPYVHLTRALLERFGATSVEQLERGGARYAIRGPLRAPAQELALEPDASAAAVALGAACLSDGALWIPGLTPASLQGDVRIVQ